MGSANYEIQQAAGKNVTKDKKTNLTVNEKLQEANDALINIADLLSTSFEKTIGHIHAVKDEFERTDAELDSSIGELLNPMDALDQQQTYERARNG